MEIESLSSQIDIWCGYQDLWETVGTINFADSNMNITDTPLDINTGINSHKFYYYLDTDITHFRYLHCACVWGMEDELQHGVPGGQLGAEQGIPLHKW